jgi:hypothetical protein
VRLTGGEPARFAAITGHDPLSEVLDGIAAVCTTPTAGHPRISHRSVDYP